MQGILLAMQAIRAGDARCVLCGGTESMSNAPYLLDRAPGGYQLGDGVLIDSLVKDGLTDPFGHGHMGLTAERLAAEYELTRQQQDRLRDAPANSATPAPKPTASSPPRSSRSKSCRATSTRARIRPKNRSPSSAPRSNPTAR
jgi:acetyl-CoA C-acetyltransferase